MKTSTLLKALLTFWIFRNIFVCWIFGKKTFKKLSVCQKGKQINFTTKCDIPEQTVNFESKILKIKIVKWVKFLKNFYGWIKIKVINKIIIRIISFNIQRTGHSEFRIRAVIMGILKQSWFENDFLVQILWPIKKRWQIIKLV